MTYTLQLTPYLAAMLDAACRATGLDTLHLFRAHLNPATGATAPVQPITATQPLATGFIPAPPVPGLEPVEGPPDFSALTSAMHR